MTRREHSLIGLRAASCELQRAGTQNKLISPVFGRVRRRHRSPLLQTVSTGPLLRSRSHASARVRIVRRGSSPSTRPATRTLCAQHRRPRPPSESNSSSWGASATNDRPSSESHQPPRPPQPECRPPQRPLHHHRCTPTTRQGDLRDRRGSQNLEHSGARSSPDSRPASGSPHTPSLSGSEPTPCSQTLRAISPPTRPCSAPSRVSTLRATASATPGHALTKRPRATYVAAQKRLRPRAFDPGARAWLLEAAVLEQS
jgi:hypothetical protein